MSTETSAATETATVAAPAAAPEPAAAPAAAAPEAPAAEPAKLAKPKADEWTRLSAAEKQARAKAAQVEADRKAFEAEKQAHAAKLARADLIDRAKAGDWEAREQLFNETGVSYDEWTKRTLTAKRDTPADKAMREVAELKAQLEREKAEAAKQAEAASWASTVEGFKHHVTKEKPEDFPLLSGEVEADPELIESTLKSMARLEPTITLRDAALKLERYFKDQTDRRAARLRPNTAPSAPAATSDTTKPRDQRGRFERGDGPRKLTNDLSAERSTPPKGRDAKSGPLSMKERDELAREAMRRAANALR